MTLTYSAKEGTITILRTGEVVNREFGVSRNSNGRVYTKILAYYVKRLRLGMTKEEAIKATHEHYDPILAKDCVGDQQTADVAMLIPNTLSASARCKDLSDLEIEI